MYVIAIDDAANDMYGKVMSITDELIPQYMTLLTDASAEEVTTVRSGLEGRTINPMEAKKRLARDIVKRIEESLTYPGQIKVTVIRETRAQAVARY